MKISIFTPTHDSKFLLDAYNSIKDQDFYEWIIVYNNGAAVVDFNDTRVKSIISTDNTPFVGRQKKIACSYCTGDILVELDHDDLLTQDAVEEVGEAFADGQAGFVFSNRIACDLNYNIREHYEGNGWEFRKVKFRLYDLEECVSFNATPASVSRIWYAPDHLRAFRRDVYEAVGGYNGDMRVLDDLDLMCKMYCVTKFRHIDKPLYVYRVHGDNAWIKNNQEIQNNVMRIYNQYIERMILRWTRENNLLAVDLGGRFNCPSGYSSVDLRNADYYADLNQRWPFGDGSVGVVRAFDVFEHLRDPIFTMKELYRVLAPGGYALIQVPSTDGRGAFQDPTHVSYWNENSFLYYTHSDWAKYIDTPVRFQPMQVYTTEKNDRQVCWVNVHLVKLVDGLRVPGQVFI